MAIQTRIVNGSHTEIYVGGGNFITQSYPTNFHQFWTHKILTASENIEDFKEVTVAEMEALEAEDAKWVRPTHSFIALWAAAGGVWNETTGYFEMNGITDITYTEAMRIYRMSFHGIRSSWENMYKAGNMNSYMAKLFLQRTYFPLTYPNYEAQAVAFKQTFAYNTMVEAVNIKGGYYPGNLHLHLRETFRGCKSLRRVIFGDGSSGRSNFKCDSLSFDGCVNLERIDRFAFWAGGNILDLSMAPKFQIDCIESCVNDAYSNDNNNTLVLHPDVYAQCSEELLSLAAEKQITIATT